jgi:hypothetical protein
MPFLGQSGRDNEPPMDRNDIEAAELRARVESKLTQLEDADPAEVPDLASEVASALAAALDEPEDS